MKMNKLAIAVGAAVMGLASVAQAEFSGNVALTSDYVFRGVSQNDSEMAIQGGFDYSHDSGFYAGVWASNVDDAAFANSSIEVDTYLGWGGDVGPVGVDVGFLRYNYPGRDSSIYETNTNEFHVGVSKDFGAVSTSFTAYYSPDFFDAGAGKYYDLGVSVPAGPVTISAHYGKTVIDEKGAAADMDYDDYSVGVSTEYEGFGFDLTYTNTNDEGVCNGSSLCDGSVALTVSRSF